MDIADTSPEPTPASDEVVVAKKSPRVGLILLAVLVVAGLVGGGWYWRYETTGKYFQSTDNAYIQSDAVVISPKIAGYVDRVFVEENQTVRQGQPLVQVDPREYQAQAAEIQAQIDIARTNAQGVRAQISEQAASIDQARAQVQAAESALAFARSEVSRYTPLAASGAEPRERLSQLRNEAQQAQAQLTSARAALVSAQRRTATLRSQVDQALSQARASEAQLQTANVNVGATIVRAPISGRIASKSVQTGQLVQAGARLMSVVPVDRLYVDANFKETQLALMRPGQPVTISVDALDGVELRGRVESVSPGTGSQFSVMPPQNATGNFTKIVQRVPVRISLEAGPLARRLLVPGLSVEVTVDTRSAKDAREQIEQEQAARQKARK